MYKNVIINDDVFAQKLLWGERLITHLVKLTLTDQYH